MEGDLPLWEGPKNEDQAAAAAATAVVLGVCQRNEASCMEKGNRVSSGGT